MAVFLKERLGVLWQPSGQFSVHELLAFAKSLEDTPWLYASTQSISAWINLIPLF